MSPVSPTVISDEEILLRLKVRELEDILASMRVFLEAVVTSTTLVRGDQALGEDRLLVLVDELGLPARVEVS